MSEYNSEDHFQRCLEKRLSLAGLNPMREWVCSGMYKSGRKWAVRADMLVTKVTKTGAVMSAWIEAKTALGMHELATALGQVLISRSMFQKGKKLHKDYGKQFEYVVIPRSLLFENRELAGILMEYGVNVSDETMISDQIKKDFGEFDKSHTEATVSVRNAVLEMLK